ncbi:trimeric intracellular cation channel family protein [Arenimonas donghaensis]|uniref:Glycine transporter domain-containing protein n=1 Tax=Arenimonas donghaensis DSM 18148 = HO3-R19 TaxID=1121014 RepID=A0A087MHB9_9GAMM|nr:TRIC cation channel family protein [Arenimonas donghaensis]KFL36272.1 hypothetical protein N788_05115 [Arenimonas donghaensis DSM 18148 = HO3-R19]
MTPLLLSTLDLVGTFAFAISGATLGVRKRLDLFGVLTLAFAAATAGGIFRDLVIGAHPPAAFGDWRYLATAMAAGVVTFFGYEQVERVRNPVQMFDAVGLALFAVAGTSKALAFGIHPVGAVLLGMISGIGGGMARDLLVTEIPAVLQRRELYAVAALLGAVLLAIGSWLELPPAPTALVAAFACFVLRYLAIRRGWMLPVANWRDPSL